MKHGQAPQHCPRDLPDPMKPRHPRPRSPLLVVLLPLVALATTLSCRSAVRPADLRPDRDASRVNSTLARLASVDPGEEYLRKQAEQLLDGTLALTDHLHLSFSTWRRFHHHREAPHLPTGWPPRPNLAVRSAAAAAAGGDSPAASQLRALVGDWLRRRRFRPQVMSELAGLLGRPPRGSPRAGSGDETPAGAGARYSSCAVVGNSGILLEREHGALIDSHELVIRLNNARTAGYERSVGAKTGLAFINSNILHLCAQREGCFCHPYGDGVPIVMYICQAAHFLDLAACNASQRAPLLVTDPQLDLLCARIVKYYSLRRFVAATGRPPEEWSREHDAAMFHYSSGMQAVMLALGACRRVGIFGFGKSPAAKHHYHTNQKAELDLHDYEAEYAFYGDLVARPRAVPFLPETGFRVPPVVIHL